MTAVASPPALTGPSRPGWSQLGGCKSEVDTMTNDDLTLLLNNTTRKPAAHRANSSASLQSRNSTASSATSPSTINIVTDDWANRKKPARGIWPTNKSEATAVISTARPLSVSSALSGPSAASAISALHTPMLSPQHMPNGQPALNGPRNGPSEPSVTLCLLPINNTFERKTITVPLSPNVVRVGRQTNAKTAPTSTNALFDSKVLSRQHAEIFADRQGRVYIRDVKSSNGTFVNGQRLSPENKESEPHELHAQDVVELGIDIVSEDQKTVVHHKVAARVEHAGIYPSATENAYDHDGGNGYGQQMKRSGPMPQGNKNLAMSNAAMMAREEASMQHQHQQQMWSRMFLQPISTELIVRKLNHELKLARLQSQDMAKLRQSLIIPPQPPVKSSPESPEDVEPRTPPPSLPLPAKPEESRSHTVKPEGDEAEEDGATRETNLESRIKVLEQELNAERLARSRAEDKLRHLEPESRADSFMSKDDISRDKTTKQELQEQLDRMNGIVNDMKQHMEQYRQRAEHAEKECQETRKSLVVMVEEKRAAMKETENVILSATRTRTRMAPAGGLMRQSTALLLPDLLSEAGIGTDQKLSVKQAAALQGVLHRSLSRDDSQWTSSLSHHGIPHACAVTTIVLGLTLMHYLNGWGDRVQR